MRIRQNARRVVPKGTQLRASFLVCKLNQSPWDDDAFVFQLFEDESNDRFSYTRSSIDPSPISDSNRIIESPTVAVFEYIGKQLSPTPPPSTEQRQEEEKQPVEGAVGANSTAPIDYINLTSSPRRGCDEPGAKRSSYRNMKYLCPPPTKKRSSPPPLPPYVVASSSKKRGRPKKHRYETRGKTLVTTSATKNNKYSDYYFYTKFGPSWGKKKAKPTDDDGRTSHNGKPKTLIIIEGDVVIYESKKNEQKELIYIDDDDDDNGDGLIPSRPWKPIKERSLKSLMSS